jgi:hypothetical protein
MIRRICYHYILKRNPIAVITPICGAVMYIAPLKNCQLAPHPSNALTPPIVADTPI